MFLFYLSACQSVVPLIGHDFYLNLSFPLLSCPSMNRLFYYFDAHLVSGSFWRYSKIFYVQMICSSFLCTRGDCSSFLSRIDVYKHSGRNRVLMKYKR